MTGKAFSQPVTYQQDKVVLGLAEAGIKEGGRVRAKITNVGSGSMDRRPTLIFCNSRTTVMEVLELGTEELEIPNTGQAFDAYAVRFENLEFLSDGRGRTVELDVELRVAGGVLTIAALVG